MKRLVGILGVCCFLGFVTTLHADVTERQATARSLLDQMRERYQESVKLIDNYTVQTDLYTAYYEKTGTDEWPSFSVQVISEEKSLVPLETLALATSSLFERDTFERIREHAVYVGRQKEGDHQSIGLRIDNVASVFPESFAQETKEVLVVIGGPCLGQCV